MTNERDDRPWGHQEVGTAEVTLEDAAHVLAAGPTIDIPRGSARRSANAGPDGLVFVECSTVTTSAKTTSSG